MIKWTYLFIGIMILFNLTFISAVGEEVFFEPNTTMDLKVYCFDTSSALCDAGVSCYLNTFYPNMTPFKTGLYMSFNSSSNYFNYTINGTTIVGAYKAITSCNDSTNSGYSSFDFYVGRPSTDVQVKMIITAIVGLLIIASLLFVGFLKIESFPFKWTMFMFSFLFFLMTVNIISISLRNEAGNENIINIFDTLTAGCYYLYWFTGGLLLIIWTLTFIAQLADKKHMRMAEQVGANMNFTK